MLCAMRRLRIITLALAVASVLAVAKKSAPDWKTAKVLDSQAVKTRTGTADIAAMIPTIRDNQLMLLSDEFAYVIEDSRVSGRTSLAGLTERAISNRHHGCRVIVGDDIQYWQEKALLHVRDADSKECKVEVIRQERLKPATAPPAE
jgi:hypothetical protein